MVVRIGELLIIFFMVFLRFVVIKDILKISNVLVLGFILVKVYVC